MTTGSEPSADEARLVLSLEPADGGPPGRLLEADGRVWLVTDAGSRPVADADVATLLARHAAALVPDAPVEHVRSERLGGKSLADLLVATLGAEVFGEGTEPGINGALYLPYGHPEVSLWPDDPDDDPDVEVVLEAFWDLLRDDSSPATGNPGVLTLLRHGEDYLVVEHAAEIAEVTRAADPLTALGEHAELAMFAQTLRIDSPWLRREGEPAVRRLLDRSPSWSPARAIFVNGCLWARGEGGWGRALASAASASRQLPDITAVAAVDFGTWDPHSPLRQARTVPSSEPPPTARPASSLDFVVLPAEASTELAATTLEAALKSGLANETHRAIPAAIVEGERPLTPFDLYDA